MMEPKTWIGRLLWDLGFRGQAAYVQLLETENQELKDDNRRLWNSLVGTKGIPPVTLKTQPEDRQGKVPRSVRLSWPQFLGKREAEDRDAHRKQLAALREELKRKANGGAGEPQFQGNKTEGPDASRR